MSLQLTSHTVPEVPLEAEVLRPDTLSGMKPAEVEMLRIMHGNQPCKVADFFKVSGTPDGEIHLEGDLSRIKHVGAGMTSGTLVIHGNIGAHLGAAMSGGEIRVEGDAADWVGPEMTGGKITITGNAGHLVGSAYRGSSKGMLGGTIIIHGDVKNELGHAMRNGLIAVGGNSGDFTGVNLLAGTIVVLGEMGIRTGAGMKRGTILSMKQAEVLPTFTYSCRYRPTFTRLLLNQVRSHGLDITPQQQDGHYHRWCGDGVELNKGELLIYTD